MTFDPTANDTDLGSGTLAMTSSTALPAGEGDLACSATACVYSPPATGFSGTASATYTVADVTGAGTAGTAGITIFVDIPALTPSSFVASDATGTAVSIGTWTGSTTTTAAVAVCIAGRVSATISWQSNPGATSRALERRLAGSTTGPWIPLANLSASTTAYVDTQLGEGNAYQWQVRPDNHRWRGDFSPPSEVSTEPAAVNAAGC